MEGLKDYITAILSAAAREAVPFAVMLAIALALYMVWA
jgi:hypothetical protein